MAGYKILQPLQIAAAYASVLVGFWFSSAAQSANSNLNLSSPVWTNGQFQFTLNSGSGIPFVVESSPDLVSWTPVLSNTIFAAHFIITAPAPDNMAFYRVIGYPTTLPPPPSAYALAARGNINIKGNAGNGPLTDSYNSSDTNLSTNGQYDPSKASTNGNVASVSGTVNIGNHTINGSLYLGPAATYGGGTNQVTGQIYTNYDVQFPDAVLPTLDANGNPILWILATTLNGTNVFGTASGTNFNYLSGYYMINSSVNNSKPIYVAPGQTVTLQLTAGSFDPSSVTVDGGLNNSGTLIIYQDAGSVTLGGNSSGGSIASRPINFQYYGLLGVTSVTLTGTTNYVEAIYAPQADLTLNVGGAPSSFCGSLTAYSITTNGHLMFHFDESLLAPVP